MKVFQTLVKGGVFLFSLLLISCDSHIDLTEASVLIWPDVNSDFGETLLQVMDEEISERSAVKLEKTISITNNRPVIVLAHSGNESFNGTQIPSRSSSDFPENLTEGYRILLEKKKGTTRVWIIGADKRGLLFGVGHFLRTLNISEHQITLPGELDTAAAPTYPIRGHQLGYRNTANSWDAWTVRQYEQYIRELMLFGSNCIEDIPFQSDSQSVHMIMPHRKMHVAISEICQKYDADYWVWTPARGDLEQESVREEELKKHEAFYKSIPRLDAIFFPGGDPGDNHPMHVMPHLEELSKLLKKYHPNAGVWISLQGFNREKTIYFFEYLERHDPDWLTGVVHGPGSPPVEFERKELPEKYMHRLYGDITHTVRCQYPVENWDQAYALTLGREATNPQPRFYKGIFQKDMPFTNGFLSYSDGVHDDVNKVLWNQLGWHPEKDPVEVMVDYCGYFFGKDVATEAAKGILELERNWEGDLAQNGGVEETLKLWQELESAHPGLAHNWRWQQLVMRAYYDAYIRARLIHEQEVEKEANRILGRSTELGTDAAMSEALAELKKAESNPAAPDLRDKVLHYCDALFSSVGLQTSVPKFQASGYERGCVLDFLDYPLNNRWWLEDEFKNIREMDSEEQKLERIEVIRTWSTPGQGSYYDNISSVSEGLHVVSRTDDAIDYAWWDNGFSRKRLSTQLFQFSPVLEYAGLDTETNYMIRISGYGEALLRANGSRLESILYNQELETFKEFILPREMIEDGRLKITFDRPDETHLNWRQYSKVTDVWLMRQ